MRLFYNSNIFPNAAHGRLVCITKNKIIDLIFHKIEITYTIIIFAGNELAKFLFSPNRAKADLILKFLRGAGNCHGTFFPDHDLHPDRSPHIRLRPTLQKNSLPIFTGAWYSTHRIRKYSLSRLRQFFLIHYKEQPPIQF